MLWFERVAHQYAETPNSFQLLKQLYRGEDVNREPKHLINEVHKDIALIRKKVQGIVDRNYTAQDFVQHLRSFEIPVDQWNVDARITRLRENCERSFRFANALMQETDRMEADVLRSYIYLPEEKELKQCLEQEITELLLDQFRRFTEGQGGQFKFPFLADDIREWIKKMNTVAMRCFALKKADIDRSLRREKVFLDEVELEGRIARLRSGAEKVSRRAKWTQDRFDALMPSALVAHLIVTISDIQHFCDKRGKYYFANAQTALGYLEGAWKMAVQGGDLSLWSHEHDVVLLRLKLRELQQIPQFRSGEPSLCEG